MLTENSLESRERVGRVQGFTCPERKGVADFLQEVTSRKDQQVPPTMQWHPSCLSKDTAVCVPEAPTLCTNNLHPALLPTLL